MAYDLAGEAAGAVLGTALAIKMVASVGLSPIAAALAERMPRKAVLVGADLLRAAVALALPFIDAVWQVYVLIFVLQAASASFTPAFQAVMPDVLPDERDYTGAMTGDHGRPPGCWGFAWRSISCSIMPDSEGQTAPPNSARRSLAGGTGAGSRSRGVSGGMAHSRSCRSVQP